MKRRLLVIGLDCATPQLVFGSLRGKLPHLSRLMEEGVWGELESTVPPITVPAWACMLSGRDPGELGIYGFRNRAGHGYEKLFIANAQSVTEKRIWDLLDEAERRSILVNIPQTYPVRPVNGKVVGCFLTPDKNAPFTWPADLKKDLDAWCDGDYVIDVKDFRTTDKDGLLSRIITMTERRFRAVEKLMEEPWDFFMFVEMGVDRLHHGFWKFHDPSHPQYPGDSNPYRDVINAYYRRLDAHIGSVLRRAGEATDVLVVSDHGAKAMTGAFCINDWLMKTGRLRLKRQMETPGPLSPDMVDWKNTEAWGEGGYYGRIFLNVEGREPQGLIPRDKADAFRDELAREIEALAFPDGTLMGNRVFFPENAYRSVRNVAPDLIAYFADLSVRAAGSVGNATFHRAENDTGPDDANHAQHGILILKTDPGTLAAAGLSPGQEIRGASIYDVFPTLCSLCGLPFPADMRGRPLLPGAGETRGAGLSAEAAGPAGQDAYSAEEEELVKKRLEDLGYI
ncbi:MAG: alkaline phosphatase family protein [Thermodesulfobacteriota bacterium]